MTPQRVTLEMTRVVTTREVTRRCLQYLLVHLVLQEEVEAMAEKGDTERASRLENSQ